MKLIYFKESEFKCPCCGQKKMSEQLLLKLDHARKMAETPFHINSAFRCLAHNKKVGGNATSSHLKGLAVDIKTTSSKQLYLILTSLIQAGFTRIGISKTFIHVDIDPDKAQMVSWVY